MMHERSEQITKYKIAVANRLSDSIMDVKDKVYTRDIFNSDS